MTDMSKIKEHMEVIGADGTHVGTVDRVENNRIKLVKRDSGEGNTRVTIISLIPASLLKSKVPKSGFQPTPMSL
jgi:hypothetical protein